MRKKISLGWWIWWKNGFKTKKFPRQERI